MSSVGRMRPRALAWLAVLALLALAAFGPSAGGVAANDTPGNNGTVKIHEGATETEPGPQNEPHVCTFHLHFFFADPEQAGTWEIQEWSPGDKGTVVLNGTYDTHGDGEDREPDEGTYTLPDGHYKLFWDGDLDTDKHDKHKVFWVDCAEESPAPTGDVEESSAPSGRVDESPSVPPEESEAPESQVPESEAPESQAPESEAPTGGVNPATGAPSSTPVGGIGGPSGPVGSPGESFGGIGGPIGGVGGFTGSPTLPPTDAVADAPTADGSSWRIVMAALAALLASVLVMTPTRTTRRR